MATRSRKRLPGLRSGSLVRDDSLRWRKADSSPWSPLHRRGLRDRPWRLVRIRVPAGETNSFIGGTDGSNPLSSSGESSTKLKAKSLPRPWQRYADQRERPLSSRRELAYEWEHGRADRNAPPRFPKASRLGCV